MEHLVGWKNERFNTTLPHILTGLYLNCVGKDIQENAMTELKPCPFCGGEAKLHIRYKPDEKRYALIVCECGAQVKSEDCWNYIEAEFKAIEAWNRRAE